MLALSVRNQDYERYLCALFEKKERQARLMTLLAFNQELAKTAEAATEAQMGMIRLKWWQEALDEIAAGKPPRKHPVVEALALYGDISPLYPLIEARLSDVECRKGFAAKDDFDRYLEQTAGYLHWLMADMPEETKAVIHKAGRFYGLVGLLRAMPYHLERGIVRQPLDVLKRYGISPAAIEQGLEKQAFEHLMAFWIAEIEVLAAQLKDEIKQAPPLIKRLHLVALLYAKELKRTRNPAAMPARLANLPLKLWLGGKFS